MFSSATRATAVVVDISFDAVAWNYCVNPFVGRIVYDRIRVTLSVRIVHSRHKAAIVDKGFDRGFALWVLIVAMTGSRSCPC